MRVCCYCGVKRVEAVMAARVKVADGPDLCFCSPMCGKEVATRIADAIVVKEGR